LIDEDNVCFGKLIACFKSFGIAKNLS